MSDLVERLRTAARKACERHNMVDQFDPTRERKPKDFIEWDAADRIEQLETAFKKITGGGVDSVEVWTIAKTALENKDE